MHYECDNRRANFLDRNWRFIGRVISLYCGLSIWGILSSKPNENPFIGLFFGSIFVFFVYAIFHEIQQANGKTCIGKCYRRIMMTFHRRTADTDIGVLEKRLNRSQFVVFAIPFAGGVALLYPKAAYVASFLVGLLASKLGEFFWEEELRAPKCQKMPVTTWYSVIIFSAFLVLAWLLDVYGLQYSISNSALPFFVVGLGSWFAIGFVGQLLISLVEHLLDRSKFNQ